MEVEAAAGEDPYSLGEELTVAFAAAVALPWYHWLSVGRIEEFRCLRIPTERQNRPEILPSLSGARFLSRKACRPAQLASFRSRSNCREALGTGARLRLLLASREAGVRRKPLNWVRIQSSTDTPPPLLQRASTSRAV